MKHKKVGMILIVIGLVIGFASNSVVDLGDGGNGFALLFILWGIASVYKHYQLEKKYGPIKEKIRKMKEQGYKVDELEQKLVEADELKW